MMDSPLLTATQTIRTVSRVVLLSGIVLGGCSANPTPPTLSDGTPGAEEAVGERLFLETRFAQAFKTFVDGGGNINDPNAGDPTMDAVETTVPGSPLTPGPFQGRSMNCRACHLVDDMLAAPGGMRTYADFARRSPIPARADGKTHAPRNSPALVNASVERSVGTVLHFDAEFNSMEDLVAATFTSRNFGWLPGERAQAVAHVARVLREDNGKGDLAAQFDGQSYRVLFTGTNSAIPEEFRLPTAFRTFVGSGTDQELFDAAVRVVSAYVKGLVFSKLDDAGTPIRSPFDIFVAKNQLPEKPDTNESPLAYTRRFRQQLLAREQAGTLTFVTSNPNRPDGTFQFHSRPFTFGTTELAGLKIFLAEPSTPTASPAEIAAGRIGNCLACHQAPHFTDFKVHNTGTTQKEYDDLHGAGQFAALPIPTLSARNADYNRYLPATEQHPAALEPFRAIPASGNPDLTDLGVWNIFANPDIPGPQAKLRNILCDEQQPCPLTDSVLLDRAVASFKTPGLRDLDHSAPFMHNGQFNGLDDIITFYRDVSAQARAGTLRNAAPQLSGIALTPSDTAALVAFLRALNEDYQ